jgi:hypothetical protein
MQNILSAAPREMNKRTHVLVGFQNKNTVCKDCRQKVVYWHDPSRCGCGDPIFNFPCEHVAGTFSMCPTWDPIDDCTCENLDAHNK